MKKILLVNVLFMLVIWLGESGCGSKQPPISSGAKTPSQLTLGSTPIEADGCPFDPINLNYTIVFSIATYQGGVKVAFDPVKFPDKTIKHKKGTPGGVHGIDFPSDGTWGVLITVSIAGDEGMMDCHSCCGSRCVNPSTGQRLFEVFYEPGNEALQSPNGSWTGLLEVKHFDKVKCSCCF